LKLLIVRVMHVREVKIENNHLIYNKKE